MGMTIAERFLALASDQPAVKAGEIVDAKVDVAMSHENAGMVLHHFKTIGVSHVWDPEKNRDRFRSPHAGRVRAHRDHAQDDPGVCQSREHPQLLRHQRGHLPPGTARAWALASRRGAGRDRFAHDDARRVRMFRHGHRCDGNGLRLGDGQALAACPRNHPRRSAAASSNPSSAPRTLCSMLSACSAQTVRTTGQSNSWDRPIHEMTIASRMVLSNLSMEMGAKVAFVPPDEKTTQLRARTNGQTL